MIIGVLLLSPAILFAQTVTNSIEVVFNAITIKINGNLVQLDNILYNGTTYVPLRKTAEYFEKQVGWDAGTNTALINEISSTSNLESVFVPDADTAIKIAEAVLVPVYGDEVLEQKPFVATLNNDIWEVNGSLSKGVVGGVAEVKISKRDGRILRLTHSK